MRTGVDARTGKLLTGWAHCVQSIGVILATRLGSRPWAREFGAAVKELQDQNSSNRTLLEFARDTAIALEKFEPGFRLSSFEMTRAGRDGVFSFLLSGDFYPRGHLGDYSLKEARDLTISGNAGSLERLEVQ
jgi:phage baseplate assembly protein W